ncbi:MAG: riboflavin biosynthesis protein RibF [Bacteroidaceae bacterium]|nr:riboflavin biosynthesis protein RibF [Bacteroidaceae bacterium]
MKTITPGTLHSLPPCAATIGFFDGVHRGHRFLLEQVKEEAAGKGLCPSVITFPTHPRQVLQPDFHPQLLSTPEEKLHLLEEAGIANCILLPFTAELSRLSAKEFMLLLRTEYNVRTLVIGYDHRFGHNRLESFEDYVRYGQELDIDIVQARAYTQENAKVSSSAIREQLSQGEVHTASRLLGYPYPLEGTVTDGYRVGRKIGFPTANLRVDHPFKLVPAEGVYAVKVEVEGQQHLGMLNIGHRPTLNNGADRSIEVHILDFAGDIYRQNIRIEFLRFLRPETKFASIEELISQIEKDKEAILKDSTLR